MKELARASDLSKKIAGDIATLADALVQLRSDLETIYPMLAAAHQETVSGDPLPDVSESSKKTTKK